MPQLPLLLLHGALGASSQFVPLTQCLGNSREVHTFDFEGHGASPAHSRPFRIEHFEENVEEYLEERKFSQVDIFGYSMGGYVATSLALKRPESVGKIITLGTKWRWNPETAARETKMLNADKIAEKVPAFARTLEERHAAYGWKNVLAATAEMMHAMGDNMPLSESDIRSLPHSVRVCVGDRDNTVSVEESAEIYRLFPNSELQVLPGTPHPIERVGSEMLARMINEVTG